MPSAHLGLEMWVCTGNVNLSMPYIKDLKHVVKKLMKNPQEAESWRILEEDKNFGGRGQEDNIMIKQIK